MREDWLQPYLEQTLEAFIVINLEGAVHDWSPGATRLFGWSRDEALEAPLADLIIPHLEERNSWSRMLRTSQTTIDNSSSQRLRLRVVTKDQQHLTVEWSSVPVAVNDEIVLVGTVRRYEEPLAIASQASSTNESVSLRQRPRPNPDTESPGRYDSESTEFYLRGCVEEISYSTGWPIGLGLMLDSLGRTVQSESVWFCAQSEVLDQLIVLGLDASQRDRSQEFRAQQLVWRSGAAVEEFLPTDGELERPIRTVFSLPVSVDGQLSAILEFYHWEEIEEDPQIVTYALQALKPLQDHLERRRWEELKSYLAAIVESSNDAIIGKDRFGTILSWNQGAEHVYGYSESEALGKSVQLILPDGVEEEEAEIREVIEKGRRLAAFETVRQHRDGSLLDISLSVSPVLDSHGKLIGSATIERDITPLKRTIRDLFDREEKLRLLMEASGEAIYGLDLDGRCTFANRACLRLLGFDSAEELLGKKMHELVHHSHADRSLYPSELCPITQTLTSGRSVHVNNEFYWRQDGSRFPVEYWASPVRRATEVVGAVVIFEDATNRLAAERTRAELAAIVESSADAIIGKSLDGTIRSWNRGATQLYGYEPEEVIGKNYSALLCGENEEMPRPVDIREQNWNVSTFEVTRRDTDGNWIEVGITESGILSADGELIGTASIERDVSVRKRRELELVEARRAAEVANRTKSDFVANISHELRTPMNAVLGMLRITLEEPLPPALRDYLGTAKDSAETLLLILDDLLDFSRMEAGRFELDPEPFSLRETFENVVKTLAIRAHQKGLELSFDVDASVPDRLEGDGYRLRQILMNLTGNAIKFTEAGEVSISLRSHPLTDDQVQIECFVEDTGVGIPERDLQRIFEPFTQVDSSITRSRTGSGLGLSICCELIKKMGGEISVTSEIGRGTRFRFTAVFRVLQSGQDPFDIELLAGHQVLVIDDSETSRRILARRLTDWGMVVKSATSLPEVFALSPPGSEVLQPDIVFVDSHMSGNSGFEMINEIRERGMNCQFILMVSPHDRLSLERAARRYDVCRLIEKPVTSSDLYEAVYGALTGEGPYWQDGEFLAPQRAREPLKLLVAEDTPANQKVVSVILERRGHQIVIVTNGREALNAIQREKFDAILMDIQMPEMDGLQATRLIRNLEPPLATIPIVAMTAHARREDRRRCLAAGMSGYVSKPIQAAKLTRLVERLVDSDRRASVSPTTETPRTQDSPWKVGRKLPQTAAEVTESLGHPLYNLNIALRRMGGDREIFNVLLTAFLKDAPLLMQEIRTAHDSGDWTTLHRAAHSLKGLAANFEALPLVNSSQILERSAKVEEDSDSGDLIDEVARDLDELIDALSTESQKIAD